MDITSRAVSLPMGLPTAGAVFVMAGFLKLLIMCFPYSGEGGSPLAVLAVSLLQPDRWSALTMPFLASLTTVHAAPSLTPPPHVACSAHVPAPLKQAEMAIMMFIQGRADLGLWGALKAIPLALGLAAAAKAIVDRQLHKRCALGRMGRSGGPGG